VSLEPPHRDRVEGGRPVRFFALFPVSAVFLLQYVAFVVYPELRDPTGSAGLIFLLIVVGVGGALWAELLLHPLSVPRPQNDYRASRPAILLVFVIGATASLVALAAGAGTYETQIGTRSVGAIASFVTPFLPWKDFGVWLAIWSSGNQAVSKKFAGGLFAFSILLDLYVAIVDARVAPFFATTLVTFVLALLSGLVKVRSLVIAAALVALLWPPLFNLRNERRVEVGANAAELEQESSSRLELNKFVAVLPVLESSVRQPDVDYLKVLRFGFIPRVLDPGRGTLNTANDLSVAANFGDKNAFSTTVFGDVYFLGGGVFGLLFYSISVGAIATYLRKRGSAMAFLAFGLVLLNFVWIELAWPNTLASFIQNMISLVFAMLFLRAIASRNRSIPVRSNRHEGSEHPSSRR
jgi:hypothetical protein